MESSDVTFPLSLRVAGPCHWPQERQSHPVFRILVTFPIDWRRQQDSPSLVWLCYCLGSLGNPSAMLNSSLKVM